MHATQVDVNDSRGCESMSPLTFLCAQGYGEEDEREWFDEDGSNGRLGKHKSRTISVNPTEGFRYSDVYFVSCCHCFM